MNGVVFTIDGEVYHGEVVTNANWVTVAAESYWVEPKDAGVKVIPLEWPNKPSFSFPRERIKKIEHDKES